MRILKMLAVIIILFIISFTILLYINKLENTEVINNIDDNIEEIVEKEDISIDDKINEEKIKQSIKNITQYIIELQPRLDETIANIIAESIVKHSKKYKFPPELITVLIYRESSFNLIAISSANCVGLMQINPKAHNDKMLKYKISYNELFKIDNNINMGCMILNEYYKREKNIIKALTRYVGGDHQKYIIDILSEFTDLQIRKYKNNDLFIINESDIDDNIEDTIEDTIIFNQENVKDSNEITETKN